MTENLKSDDYYEKLSIIGATNFSTNSALMVQARMGYALIIEGGLPFLEDSNVCMRPLYPELVATSVLAWKREPPFGAAVNSFLEFIKCFLGMKTS